MQRGKTYRLHWLRSRSYGPSESFRPPQDDKGRSSLTIGLIAAALIPAVAQVLPLRIGRFDQPDLFFPSLAAPRFVIFETWAFLLPASGDFDRSGSPKVSHTISGTRILMCLEPPTSRREKVMSRSNQKSVQSRYPMSKQFYVYLLPADVESLVDTLKSQLDVSLIQPSSTGPYPVKLESPVCNDALMLKEGAVRVDCFVTRKDADIKMRFVQTLSHWSVQADSEVIEFQGCEFDGSVLVRGRFYLQNDFLAEDMIAPKQTEFHAWADKVFRLTKKSLNRSKALDAYVGEHAEKWRRDGGRFAWMVTPERGPIYESEAGSAAR